MSVRFSTKGWLLRILFLAMGVASAILALWVFYFRPWLGWSSGLDPWLDRHRYAITALCSKGFTLGSQLGVIAALVAILFFVLALRRWPGVWVGDDSPAIPKPVRSHTGQGGSDDAEQGASPHQHAGQRRHAQESTRRPKPVLHQQSQGGCENTRNDKPVHPLQRGDQP